MRAKVDQRLKSEFAHKVATRLAIQAATRNDAAIYLYPHQLREIIMRDFPRNAMEIDLSNLTYMGKKVVLL